MNDIAKFLREPPRNGGTTVGTFDDYGNPPIQLKTGPCVMKEYGVGDRVEISDGVHVGYEGVVVVIDGKLAATLPNLVSKWGGRIDPAEVLLPLDHLAKLVRELSAAMTEDHTKR